MVVCRARLVPASSAALTLLTIQGASSVTIRGMNLTGSAGAGMKVQNATDVSLVGLQLNNLATGLSVSDCHPRANVSLSRSEVSADPNPRVC